MKFTDAIRSVFRQYAVFSGRARRSEYWFFQLFQFLCSMVIAFVAVGTIVYQILNGSFGDINNPDDPVGMIIAIYTSPGFILLWLFSLAMLIPNLAVWCRRLHDIGKSGWFILIFYVLYIVTYLGGALLAVFGAGFDSTAVTFLGIFLMIAAIGWLIYMLVLLCTDSQPGENQYGPNPKGIGI